MGYTRVPNGGGCRENGPGPQRAMGERHKKHWTWAAKMKDLEWNFMNAKEIFRKYLHPEPQRSMSNTFSSYASEARRGAAKFLKSCQCWLLRPVEGLDVPTAGGSAARLLCFILMAYELSRDGYLSSFNDFIKPSILGEHHLLIHTHICLPVRACANHSHPADGVVYLA